MSKGKVAIIAVAAFVAVDALAIITGNGDRFGVGLSALALFAAYFAPMFIASSRGIANAGSVTVINVCLGWTCIGWVAPWLEACTTDLLVVMICRQLLLLDVYGPAASASWATRPKSDRSRNEDGD
jgi:Superinfection immunity protein